MISQPGAVIVVGPTTFCDKISVDIGSAQSSDPVDRTKILAAICGQEASLEDINIKLAEVKNFSAPQEEITGIDP